MENTTFVSDTELTSYINQSYFELYDLLVQKYGDDYYVATAVTFTTDGTSQLYALPNGTNYSAAAALYKLLGVDLSLGNSSWATLKRFTLADRNRLALPNLQSFYGRTNLRYRLSGSNLWLTPIPQSGQTIQLLYIPKLTTLSADGDTVEGVSGWTEYIIIDAAIKCLQKEESLEAAGLLMQQKQAMIKRIEEAAENRDAGMPMSVSDTQYRDFYNSGGGFEDGAGGFY